MTSKAQKSQPETPTKIAAKKPEKPGPKPDSLQKSITTTNVTKKQEPFKKTAVVKEGSLEFNLMFPKPNDKKLLEIDMDEDEILEEPPTAKKTCMTFS